MRTRTQNRLGWSAAWALALVFGAPAFATAQTTELFPFRSIRRERVPFAMEDPVYKLYRKEYYGYHPTCWRKFPTGWGCPSPEGPDSGKAFKDLPRDKPDAAEPVDDGADNGAGMPGGNADRPARGGAGRGPLPPLPAGDRSPFDLEQPGAATPPPVDPPETKPALEPGAAEGGAGLPPAAEPEANMPAAPPVSRGAEQETTQPLLALPDPTVAPSARVVVANADAAMIPSVSVSPARAPRRTSLIGNLFSGLGIRRR